MSRFGLAVVSVCAFLPMLSPLEAQAPQQRRGLWIAGGIGASSLKTTCLACTEERTLGIAGFVGIGGSPSTRASVGFEFNGWTAPDPNRQYINGTAVIYYFPSFEIPLFVKAGVGAGWYREDRGAEDLSANGFMFQAGAGYDFAITARLKAAPFFHYQVAPSQRGKRGQIGLSDDIDLTAIQFGAQLSWR